MEIRSAFPALFCQEEVSFFVYCVYMHVPVYQNGTDCLCRFKFDFDYCYYQVTMDQPIRLVWYNYIELTNKIYAKPFTVTVLVVELKYEPLYDMWHALNVGLFKIYYLKVCMVYIY